jgi:hypothetical protein
MLRRAVLAAFFWAGLALVAAGLPAQDEVRPDATGRSEEIRRLIGQLDSQRYRDREEAARKLLQLEEALPALRRVLQSPASLEQRRRVEQILAVFRRREQEKERTAAIQKGKHVAADLLVERLVLRGKDATADDWQALADLARAMTLWAGQTTGEPSRWYVPLEKSFLQYPLRVFDTWEDEGTVKTNSKRLVIGGKSTGGSLGGIPVVCRRKLELQISLDQCVLLLNGDLQVRYSIGSRIFHSVIFCDGDVVATIIEDSVIVATGTVTALDKRFSKNNVIVQKARNPLPFLRVFETADVGVEVAAAEGGVEVNQLHASRAFARAGVRAGDRIAAVGGTAVMSAEHFRRLLRGKVVEKADAALTVRRGAQEVQLCVSLRD